MSIALGVDNDHDAGRTFQLNFPEAHLFEKRIQDLRPRDLLPHIAPVRDYILVFSACAPCQPFSKQNRNRVRRITKRHQASLLDQLHRFIRFFAPEYLFLENVPGMQQISERTGPFARFLGFLDKLGYWVDKAVVHSQDYGVPQRRQRLVLLASKLDRIVIPKATHAGDGKKTRFSTVWEWISYLPPIAAGEEHPKIPNHRARSLSSLNLKRIRNTPEGGDRRDWPRRLLLDCHKEHDGHSDVYGRLSKHKPASALTTRCITLSNGRFGHPTQDRALSVREAACIQTFPRNFIFLGNFTSMGMQVGNAVPILLAEKFGRSIIRHYRGHLKTLKD